MRLPAPVSPPSQRFRKTTLRLVLGTDEHIPHERRVGMLPQHLDALRARLADHGLTLEIVVHTGAGVRAGFADDAYRAIGAQVTNGAPLEAMPAADIVHALKEPTEWESRLAGPFLRIGAVHLASKPTGVCTLLATRNALSIVDGGTVGNCSYLLDGGDRTPIVASMSRFAGRVAATKLTDGIRANGIERGTLVVVGGGVAGLAAIEQAAPIIEQLVVVEPYRPYQPILRGRLDALGLGGRYTIVESIEDGTLQGAVGIVFAHRSGAKAAEKVCTERQIREMRPGAGIADIAIDQCGSILHDGYREEDDAPTARAKYQQLFGGDFYYYAEVNMPREQPREASEEHGDAVLRYLETLLLLCALEGGPTEALATLRRLPRRLFQDPAELGERDTWSCLLQDLRNGLQLSQEGGSWQVDDEDLEADTALMSWLRDCAKHGCS